MKSSKYFVGKNCPVWSEFDSKGLILFYSQKCKNKEICISIQNFDNAFQNFLNLAFFKSFEAKLTEIELK